MRNKIRAYISFETALDFHNVIDRNIHTIEYASLSRDERKSLDGKIHKFWQVPEEHFFGFNNIGDNGYFIAEPEKAVLDYIYLCARKGITPDLEDVDWKALSKDKLDNYSKRMGVNYKDYLPIDLGKLHHPKYKEVAEDLSSLSV